MTHHLTAEALRKDFLTCRFWSRSRPSFLFWSRINCGEHAQTTTVGFRHGYFLGTWGGSQSSDDQDYVYSAFEDKGIISASC